MASVYSGLLFDKYVLDVIIGLAPHIKFMCGANIHNVFYYHANLKVFFKVVPKNLN